MGFELKENLEASQRDLPASPRGLNIRACFVAFVMSRTSRTCLLALGRVGLVHCFSFVALCLWSYNATNM